MDKLFERKTPYHNFIHYYFNLPKQNRLVHTGNACWGYNYMLREKIKFTHSSPAYLINVLNNEEDEFRKFILAGILKKKVIQRNHLLVIWIHLLKCQ